MKRILLSAFIMIALLNGIAFFAVAQAVPTVGGCEVFPANNPWNTDISGAAVHANSANFIANINANGNNKVHPDFGEYAGYGIPYITVDSTQPKVPVTFDYDDESDPGPYPIPSNAPIEGEGSGDRHVLVIETDNCILYETYASIYVGGAQKAWEAGSGAIFNLNSNALRPATWTSAAAAGLPIFPGLARCDEAEAGEINHALRFTVRRTRAGYIYPATHDAPTAPNNDPDYPVMGLRLRMKASYDTSGFTGQSAAIVAALKKYGMILADNGSNWYISGERNRNSCWDDDDLRQLKNIVAADAFEVIVSPPAVPGTLVAPSLYAPADGGQTGANGPLDWNTVTGATRYEVQVGTTNPPTGTPATVQATAYTQYVPPGGLVQGFTYYWRVRAFDATNNPTGWSPVRSFLVASPSGAAPTRILFNTTTPTLSWNRVTWAAGYRVQVSKNSNFSGTPTQSPPLAATTFSYQITPALTSGLHYWRVCALDNAGTCSLWSPPESFVIAPGS